MPVVSDVRHPLLIYNPSTLSLELWTGSLSVGSLVIGAVTQSGTWNVGITGAVSLPSGASTEATLASIDGKIPALSAGRIPVVLPAGGTGLTDTELRASAVPVSLASVPSHAVTNAGTFSVQVSSAPTTAVTGTFFQATQPVSGTVTANAGTGPFPVSDNGGSLTVDGTFFQSVQPVSDNAGSITVDAPVGTPAFVRLSDGAAAITTLPVSLATLPALVAGTANIGDVDVLTLPALVAGTANIGDVDVLTLPSIPAGTNNIGDVDVLTMPAITGTVTANAGTNLNTSALALDATLTNATQKTKIVDSAGVNAVAVDANGALAVQAGGATGSAIPARAISVGGTDGTNLRALKVSSAGVVSVDQTTGQGKTLLFGAITQGAAGTTQLVAADATKKAKLVSYVVILDAAGSIKFTDGTADLSGVMAVAANGGVSAIGQPSAHVLETAAVNRALSITTVTGKAFGHFSYFLEA